MSGLPYRFLKLYRNLTLLTGLKSHSVCPRLAMRIYLHSRVSLLFSCVLQARLWNRQCFYILSHLYNGWYYQTAICESGESSGASTPGSEKEVVLVNNAAALTQHPARQGVMDFLRVIVLDSMTLSFSGKATPVSTDVYHWFRCCSAWDARNVNFFMIIVLCMCFFFNYL